jgi:UDP-N-acetylmuramoyl-L-alanyl-D-glutamate--2,6-diaminopimelate ligase
MKLGIIAREASSLPDGVDGGAAGDVTGFAIDHRKVAPGNVFGAFAGCVNGEDFIADAVAAGAVAVVARPEAKVVGAGPYRRCAAAPSPGWPRASSRPCPKPWSR